MAKASQDRLEELHDALAEKLIREVQSEDCDAATLNAARQFLKDNDITGVLDGDVDGSMKDLAKEIANYDPDQGGEPTTH